MLGSRKSIKAGLTKSRSNQCQIDLKGIGKEREIKITRKKIDLELEVRNSFKKWLYLCRGL